MINFFDEVIDHFVQSLLTLSFDFVFDEVIDPHYFWHTPSSLVRKICQAKLFKEA
jgi:hypothetical protein